MRYLQSSTFVETDPDNVAEVATSNKIVFEKEKEEFKVSVFDIPSSAPAAIFKVGDVVKAVVIVTSSAKQSQITTIHVKKAV